jgi:proton-translocating NADH-quinone oxidoreductase chain N
MRQFFYSYLFVTSSGYLLEDNFLLFQEYPKFGHNFKIVLPEIFLASAILVMVIHSSLITSSKNLGYPLITRSLNNLSILVLILCFSLVINVPNSLTIHLVYQNTFIWDSLSFNIKQIILLSSISCLCISGDSVLANRINNFEYFILVLCAILGLILLISSYDFLSFYFAIEMQSLCFFVLAASKKDSSFSIEAGLKYFILSSLASAFLLLGISILYGCSGTTNFESFSLLFSAFQQMEFNFLIVNGIRNALICISVAFFFKIGAAPFHMWLPDVYEGSPTSVSLFFAIVPKIVLFASFLRVFQNIFSFFSDFFLSLLTFCCISSVFVGAFATLRQKKLKRLLAYSSISHVGYLLLAFSSNSIEGIQSLFFYILIYMFTSFGLWSTFLSLNTSVNIGKSTTLVDLASICKINPLFGFSIMLALFSLAGIPPLAGFFAKIEVFINALNVSLHFISFFAILSSIVSAFYYIRLIKTVYFEKSPLYFSSFTITPSCSFFLTISIFSSIYLFINPCLLLLFAQKMALSIFL